jgi:hypothetical protein
MDEPIIDSIRTRLLQIYDQSDRLRMQMYAHKGIEPKMTILNEDGTPAIEISSIEKDSDSRRITLFGKGHKWRLQITCNDNGSGINIFDQDGTCVKTLMLSETDGTKD